jgi:hypothetical protein
MPAGIRISSVRVPRRRPWPSHPEQGLSTIRPSPPQVAHGRVTTRKPCENRCRPRPPQAEQSRGCDPFAAPDPEQASQTSSREIASGAVMLKAASRKETSMR